MRKLGFIFLIIIIIMTFIAPPVTDELKQGYGLMGFVALIFIVLGKSAKKIKEEKRKELERPCPFCKEPILIGAIKCKHCHSEIPIEKDVSNAILKKNGFWECSACHIKMLEAGDYCSKCRKHKKEVAVLELPNSD